MINVLATGAPDARIFVVSQPGSPLTAAKALTLEQRIRIGGQKLAAVAWAALKTVGIIPSSG